MQNKKIKLLFWQIFNNNFITSPKMSIKFKFILAVIICLMITMGIGVWKLNLLQLKAFENEILNRTELVLSFGQASRNYVINQLTPAVEKHTDAMIFEAKSNAYATRSIFEIFNQNFPEYIYRQTSLNPLNMSGKADEFEAQIIAKFKENPAIKQLTGYKKLNNQELFYVAKPIKVEASCLQCHGRVAVAPQEIQEKYGTNHGYNWLLNDINSALMIYVPTKDIRTHQTYLITIVLSIFVSLTVILIILIYVLFNKLVGSRIGRISQVMSQAALNPGLTARINEQASDEIGVMVKIFNRMADSLDDSYNYLEHKVAERTAKLEQTLQELQIAQTQLIQTEKMSSLGQLVAGVAHEINNPLSFIVGNLDHADVYIQDILNLIELFQQKYPQPDAEIQEYIEEVDLDFLLTDLPNLFNSMKIGSDRISQIVTTLRNFSRLEESEMKSVYLCEGIESTLVILQHRLKANSIRPEIQLIKEYGELPLVECYPGQLNQVFMNLLANAIDALDAHFDEGRTSLSNSKIKQLTPQILIRTEIINSNAVKVQIVDNAGGIPEKVKSQIFNPFFTTKPIGKGTGLGLSISYKIIVEKHQGLIWCESKLHQGTTFCIQIPIKQKLQ